MRYVLRYVFPVAFFLVLILAFPAPRGMVERFGLAQVLPNDPTACLATCETKARQAIERCASSGEQDPACHQAATESLRLCHEECARPSTSVSPTPIITSPKRPIVPAPIISGTRTTESGAEILNLTGCQATCSSLGNAYGNTCLAAGRTRAQCQRLYDDFVSLCSSFSCRLQPPGTISPLVGRVLSCLNACGGENGSSMYDLCLKQGSASACADSMSAIVNRCLPSSCSQVISSTANVPSQEVFDSVMRTETPVVPAANGLISPVPPTILNPINEIECRSACALKAQQAYDGCRNANGNEGQCSEIRNRIHGECLRGSSCLPGSDSGSAPSVVLPRVPVLQSPTLDQPPTSAVSPLTETIAPPTRDTTQIFSSPNIGQVIWESVTNFFGGIFGREETPIPDYIDDFRTGQNIPTMNGYFIVEVWTAERCGSACDAYSNIERKPDGTAYYLTTTNPITKASPVAAAIQAAYESKKILSKDIRVVHYHGNGQDLYPDPKGDGTKMLKIWGEVPKVLITRYDDGKEVATSGSFSPNERGGIDSIIQAIDNLE